MKVKINTHREHRKAAYPPLEEQLDMLWHAMDQGEIPPAREWYETIKRIKENAPKQPQR